MINNIFNIQVQNREYTLETTQQTGPQDSESWFMTVAKRVVMDPISKNIKLMDLFAFISIDVRESYLQL